MHGVIVKTIKTTTFSDWRISGKDVDALISRVIRYIFLIMIAIAWPGEVLADAPPSPWSHPKTDPEIAKSILYMPISDHRVKAIKIEDNNEGFVDLLEVNNERIKPLAGFDDQYQTTYKGYSKIRLGVYKKLLNMLKILPQNIGIAYYEGLRPLAKQKEYFDNKFRDILVITKDKEKAYQETTKHVSPFINNIPTHATGAAIDITLFLINEAKEELVDMGKFGVFSGSNDQQETFSSNTTEAQRKNRLILLTAASRSGLINYGYEWWHYSYGDKMWAYVTKRKAAIYQLAVDKNDPILLIDKKIYLDTL